MKQHIIKFAFASLFYFPSATGMAQEISLELDLEAFEKKKGLHIGDYVPDIKFKMLNYSKPTIKLSDFRGKLVILDFWATWCESCIESFPKMELLQTAFKDKLQILLVNSTEKVSTIETFLRKRKDKGHSINLGSAVQDSMASAFFPRVSIPHYAWISPQGNVLAITSSADITADNIKKSLNGEFVRFGGKKEYYSDRIFSIGEIPIDRSMRYMFFKKGRITGLRSFNKPRIVTNSHGERLVVGRMIYNKPLLEIYETALITANDDFWSGTFSKKRMIIKVKDSSVLYYDSARGGNLSRDAWEKEGLFTCDLVVQESDVNNLQSNFLDHLNMSTKYFGRIESMQVKCLRLVNLSEFSGAVNNNKEKSLMIVSNKRIIRNLSVSETVFEFNNYHNTLPLIVKDPVAKGRISLDFDVKAPDLDDIKRQLNKQGFDLIDEVLELNMFVLSDKARD